MYKKHRFALLQDKRFGEFLNYVFKVSVINQSLTDTVRPMEHIIVTVDGICRRNVSRVGQFQRLNEKLKYYYYYNTITITTTATNATVTTNPTTTTTTTTIYYYHHHHHNYLLYAGYLHIYS
jgi:hypothetical protein